MCRKCGVTGLFTDEQKKEHLVMAPKCADYFKIRVRREIKVEEPNNGHGETPGITAVLAQAILRARAMGESPKPHIIDVLSRHFLTTDSYFTFTDTNEMVFYDESSGHYVFGGENRIRTQAQRIIDETGYRTQITTSMVNEIIGMVQRTTFITREEFAEPLDMVNLINGVLNITTGEFAPHSPNFKFLTRWRLSTPPKPCART